MLNLNISYSLKADQSPELNAAFVAAFINALETKGYSINSASVKPVKVAQNAKEKGPNEMQYLQEKGLTRMLVPSSWQGTREEYAVHALTDETPVEQEESEDPLDIFHK